MPLSWLLWPSIFPLIVIWQVVLGTSVLLLIQSLVRDIAILLWRPVSKAPQKIAQCFCLETSVGIIGILISAVIGVLSSLKPALITQWDFILITFGTLIVGFIIQDWVITLNPLGIRKEKDHLNIIVRWRK